MSACHYSAAIIANVNINLKRVSQLKIGYVSYLLNCFPRGNKKFSDILKQFNSDKFNHKNEYNT